MTELIEGRVYECADGQIRKLNKIEDHYLSYSVPISEEVWIDLGRTYRHQVEKEFLNGTLIGKE